jgi:hypothetical protein
MSEAKRTIQGDGPSWGAGDQRESDLRDRHTLRGLPIFGIGVAGIVLGHWLSYLIAVPDPHVRFDLLARTGHFYLPFAAQVAAIACLAAIGALVLLRLHADHEGLPATGALILRLVVSQVVLYLAVEVVERFGAGAPLGHMLEDDLLPIGVAVQVIVAIAGGILLRWLSRAAERLAGAFAGSLRPVLPPAGVIALLARRQENVTPLRALRVRGPPSP